MVKVNRGRTAGEPSDRLDFGIYAGQADRSNQPGGPVRGRRVTHKNTARRGCPPDSRKRRRGAFILLLSEVWSVRYPVQKFSGDISHRTQRRAKAKEQNMNLTYAVERLLETGWTADEQLDLDRLPDGRRYPSVLGVQHEFARAGLELAIKQNLMFNCYRATWGPMGEPLDEQPRRRRAPRHRHRRLRARGGGLRLGAAPRRAGRASARRVGLESSRWFQNEGVRYPSARPSVSGAFAERRFCFCLRHRATAKNGVVPTPAKRKSAPGARGSGRALDPHPAVNCVGPAAVVEAPASEAKGK